jgi:hypothetical protein
VLYLLKCLDEGSEGKIILKPFLYLKICSASSTKITCYCLKNKKQSPTSNTVIITEVMAVISGKHSDRDNEPD